MHGQQNIKISHKCLIMTSRTAGFAMNPCQWNSKHKNTCRTWITSNKISNNSQKI